MSNLGLVSISFRDLSVEQIIDLCRKNGLKSVEWGGDTHVPHGDTERAKRVYELCENNGISVAAYGSYYRVCPKKTVNPEWSSVLDTAACLHASVIRVWICEQGSEETSNEEFLQAVKECREISEAAAQKGITVCCECHPYTLTDDYNYTMRLLKEVNHPNFKLYWQPNQFKSLKYNLDAIKALREHIVNVHTFYWEGWERLSLKEGIDVWKAYLQELKDYPKNYLFEFMPNGTTDELPEQIEIFKEIEGNYLRG